MHRSSQKRNETQRSGQTLGLRYHFNKKEGLGVKEQINCGKGTRKYIGETNGR